MSRKIFISYRRQESAANALGIGQYLENEFGRKNVFIDIDMHAGAKFPKVLEQRLAECAVMLVLIGPGWLDARDEQGHRRLDYPDDWVRLEIAQALKRDITVIPVRLNGAELPRKAELPHDIRALLDHQAVSVTTAGFRHEMSGLVHDIRSISKPQRWRYAGAIGVGLALLLAVLALVQTSDVTSVLRRIKSVLIPPMSKVAVERDIWRGTPGEWVLYQVGSTGIPFYFKPSSVKTFGDRVIFTSRFPSEPDKAKATQGKTFYPGYEDDITVVDCKKSISAMAERTNYNSSGDVLNHFKWGDPHSLDLSIGGPIKSGTIVATAERIMCDEQLRTPVLTKEQIGKLDFSYLANTPAGDGDIYYGPKKTISNVIYPYEIMLVFKLYQDHKIAELFTPQPVITDTYRAYAERVRFNCKDRKVLVPKIEYFDSENILVELNATSGLSAIEVQQGSPLDLMLNVGCGPRVPQVQGTYEGTNDLTTKDGHGDQKISLVVKQNGKDISVSYQTPFGGQGAGTGTLTEGAANSMLLKSTAPNCPGSYEASFKFADDTISWTYKGQDCGGPVQGRGTAKKT